MGKKSPNKHAAELKQEQNSTHHIQKCSTPNIIEIISIQPKDYLQQHHEDCQRLKKHKTKEEKEAGIQLYANCTFTHALSCDAIHQFLYIALEFELVLLQQHQLARKPHSKIQFMFIVFTVSVPLSQMCSIVGKRTRMLCCTNFEPTDIAIEANNPTQNQID